MAALSESPAGPWTPFAKATAPRQCCDVQWCGDTVIAATYDYIEDEGLRRGGLCALAVGGDGALAVRSTLELRGGYAVAVEPGTAQLACATADGRVALAAVGDDGALSLSSASEPRGHLFTSVEWCGDGELTVAEGDSGAVSLWRRAGDGVVEERRWAAHDYGPGCPAEVWCATRGAGLVYSGADDGTLKAWDPRTPGPSRAASLRHDAGVTSVLALEGGGVATGSYDEHLRLWDLRRPRAAVAAVRLGGGVYALRGDGPGAFLAACMDAGVHRVVTSDGGALADAGAYAHHGSLAYGAARHAATRVVASCSFYDREVHLWRDG